MDVLAFVAVFVLIAAVLIAARLRPSSSKPWPLESKRVLSPPEQVLYFRLIQALPDCVVLAQVQLSRMLVIKASRGRTAVRNRIDRKSADFVVCARDFTVRAVIELDDSSHDRADRKRADADKDAALVSAGVPVLRFNVKAMPDSSAIQAAIANARAPK